MVRITSSTSISRLRMLGELPILSSTSMTKRKLKQLIQNFSVALGVILIWRGIWYMLDGLDLWFFQGEHAYSAVGGIIVGILILYLPDKDLKELGKI